MLKGEALLEVEYSHVCEEPWDFEDREVAAKMPIPSRAQVAREFAEAVFRSHTNANYKLPLAETMGIVLKEWEEADGKSNS